MIRSAQSFKFMLSKGSPPSSKLSVLPPSTVKVDCTIVGGGIVGLATARELILRFPRFKFALVEKEPELSQHQSKNNSGVIHAGIYYAPGSLKAKLCVEGLQRSYAYLDTNKLPYKRCGKLIVATNDVDLSRLDTLYGRVRANNVPGIRMITDKEIKEIEPKCGGKKAIYSPETGIVDWRVVALSFAKDFTSCGGKIFTGFEADTFTEARENSDYPIVIGAKQTHSTTEPKIIQSKFAITCGGLQSDRIAQKTGCSPDPKIIPFRGDYLKLKDEKCDLVKTNIYPVPDPRFPFLGVHFTPRMDGSVWLGPNALLSFNREGYGRFSFKLRDTVDSLTYPGLLKLGRKYLAFGANEFISDIFIQRLVKQLQRFVPTLQVKDVERGPCGIRAQALNRDGTLVDDFVIDIGNHGVGRRIMHVRNAPSPAATSSLAIARMLADTFQKKFELPDPHLRNTV
ncbi:unnamed protein product [Calicophoron daubneyi]|uniref:L-2-hydroxyglutarate dehydrogenase, mitochondrial n=1 Tax=Calicophoron daubneyi TaxID=300641 RepID=A0AAV2TQN3_CALDB